MALITGASDRGIGGEIAVRLAREGAAVALISRRVPERLLKKLNRFEHGAVHTAGDVTKADDIARAIDDCMGEFGKLDIVVNNAGVELARSLDKFSDDEWRQLLDVNLNGAIAVTQGRPAVSGLARRRDREHRLGPGPGRLPRLLGL